MKRTPTRSNPLRRVVTEQGSDYAVDLYVYRQRLRWRVTRCPDLFNRADDEVGHGYVDDKGAPVETRHGRPVKRMFNDQHPDLAASVRRIVRRAWRAGVGRVERRAVVARGAS